MPQDWRAALEWVLPRNISLLFAYSHSMLVQVSCADLA